MTTKEQERKALEQIRKIVEGLGEDSYIGTAFEGCFRVAEENIENDWACSMKERAELAERNLVLERNRIMELQKEIEARETEVKEANEDAQHWRDKYHNLSKRFDELSGFNTQNWNKFREQEDRADALEQEIIKLKAKLYDLMVADN